MADGQTLTDTAACDTGPAFFRWICIGCGHEWPNKRPPPSYCRQCGVQGGYAPEEIELLGSRSDDVGTVTPGVVVPEWAAGLPDGIPLGHSLLLRGRPGGGKSRASYRLSSQIGTTAVFGLEMGKKLSRKTAENAGALLGSFWWYDDVRGLEELTIIEPDVVVVDSIQKLGRDRGRVIDRLRRWALDCDKNVIFVSQLGQHGSSRHGEDSDFDCDIVIDVSKGKLEQGPRKAVHGTDETESPCAPGCAHCHVAKSRVCPLVSFDVPIVA